MSDLIDRQALLKQIDIDSDGEPGYYGDTWKFIDTIKNMPNVHDLPKDTDTISRAKAIEALKQQAETMSEWSNRYAEQRKGILTAVNIVEDLPPAQPERIKGHWIIRETSSGDTEARCSHCGFTTLVDEPGNGLHMVSDLNFCPNCGAEMRGEQDE